MDSFGTKGKPGRATVILFLFIFWLSFQTLLGCSPKIVEKIVTITTTEVRDSLAWRDTTVYVPIPLESDQAIVHVGDTSHRETSVAESDAWIGDDGMLHHTLSNKDTRISYGLTLPEHWLTTTVTNTTEKEHTIIKEVKIEKPLSLWNRFRLHSFWWLLGGLILSLLWIFRKYWLSILKIIK